MKINQCRVYVSLLFFAPTIIHAKTISITNSRQFQQEVTDSGQPAVVKFYTEWCGPCKMSKVPFHQVSDQPEFSHVKFVEVDADKNTALMNSFNIEGFPTFIFMVGPSIKQKTAGLLGAFDSDDFKVKLEKTLRHLFPTDPQKKAKEDQTIVPQEQTSGFWITISEWFSNVTKNIKQFFASMSATISEWVSE